MKTSLKLIPGAMLVLLFLITACNLYRRPIPDEMIGEHRIHRADGFMTQDYRLAINPVNDSVYDIKLWEKKSSSRKPEQIYYDGLRFHYRDTVHISTKCVTSGTETYRVNKRRVTRDKNPRTWYTIRLSSGGFVMSDSLIKRQGVSDEQHRKWLYKQYGKLTFREGKIVFLNSRCPAFYLKKQER